jgi:hypothetical protein
MPCRLGNLVPLNSIAAENVGSHSNASVSSTSTTEEEGAHSLSLFLFFLQFEVIIAN